MTRRLEMLTKEIPHEPFNKVPLAEEAFVLEHKLEIPRIIDDNARRESGYPDLECLVPKLTLALGEPREELPPGLQEEDSILHQG